MTYYVKTELKKLEELLIDKIRLCCTGIHDMSVSSSDLSEAESIQRLVETLGTVERIIKEYGND